MVVKRFEVYLVSFDPAAGGEIRKTRPAVVVSPDESNRNLLTAVVAPLTSGKFPYPARVPCRFNDRDGVIVLDQIRTVDAMCLYERIGVLSEADQDRLLEGLAVFFAR